MSTIPPSCLAVCRIIETWRQSPAAAAAGSAGVDAALLDALEALVAPVPVDALRTACAEGDPRALGAMTAIRGLMPVLMQEVLTALRDCAARGDGQSLLARLPVYEALGQAMGDNAALGEAAYLRGYMLRRSGQLFGAIAAYQRAVALGTDAAFRSRTWDRLGNVQREVGAFDEALESFRSAAEIEADPANKATILRNLALALRDLGELAAAQKAERQAAKLVEGRAKDGYALDAAAQDFARLGDVAWALELSDRAKAWFMENNPVGLPVNAEIRAAILAQAGRAEEAAAQFRLALGLFAQQAAAMVDAAHYQQGWRRGWTARQPIGTEALQAFLAAQQLRAQRQSLPAARALAFCIDRAVAADDHALALRARALRGGWLFTDGMLSEAAAELEPVQSEASERGLALPEMSALVTLSAISQSGGDIRRKPLELLCRARHLRDLMAAFLAEQPLDELTRLVELNDTGALETQLGQYASEFGVWPEAADFFQQALLRAERSGDRWAETNRLAGLRRAAAKAGETERAAAAAQRLRALCEDGAASPAQRIVGARDLNAHWRERDAAAAARWIETAADAAEALRAAAAPGRRDGIDRQWHDVFWTLAQARREAGQEAAAFDAVQLGKFRGLAEAIAVRRGEAAAPARLASVQPALAETEVLLDIAGERGGLAGYAVTRTGITSFLVPGDVAALSLPDQGDMRDRAAALLALARQSAFLTQFAAAAEARLPPGARLLIAPDPRLSNLPLHAIPVGGAAWCETRRIGYVPAAAALTAPRRGRTGRVLVMGDARGDLPGARRECEAVAARYGTKALLGPDCTAQALIGALQEGPLDIMHIATHGRGNPRRGSLSSLLLVNEAGEPEWVELGSLIQSPWEVGLVVLSGCSTGLIGRRDGYEFVSVAASVLRAGAGAVVACLWPVGDGAAGAVMTGFHDALVAESADVIAALDAARQVLHAPTAEEPLRDGHGWIAADTLPREQALTWSAFVALGLPEPFAKAV